MDIWNKIVDLAIGWFNSGLSFTTNRILPSAVILLAGIIIIAIVLRIVSKMLEKTKLEKAAHTLIKSALRVLLYLLLCLIVASKLGIDVTAIVALASVLTLAISLAVQNALSNVIGGFTLLSTRPFSSGDFVEIAGQSGSVLEIGLTYTKLATADNKIVSIPNNSVVAAQIINYTTSGTRRVSVNVCVAYTNDTEQVLEALRQAGSVPTALSEKAPFAAVESYEESTVKYVLHVWCKSEDYWTTLFDTNKNIKAVFAEKNVAFSFPHLNIHVDR